MSKVGRVGSSFLPRTQREAPSKHPNQRTVGPAPTWRLNQVWRPEPAPSLREPLDGPQAVSTGAVKVLEASPRTVLTGTVGATTTTSAASLKYTTGKGPSKGLLPLFESRRTL